MKLIKKLLWTTLTMVFFVSMVTVNVSLASPETYFWVDPPVVAETPDGKLLIRINIAEAPETYAWEFIISWDPDRLELVRVTEGDFLHRWEEDPWGELIRKYDTEFVYDGWSLDEANVEGEIRVGSTLKGDVPWASGDGWLSNLEFLVQKRGEEVLDLFDTRLWDHMEWDPDKGDYYPAFTYYDNVDCYVMATNFYYAGLAGWKLKVNGKAGVSVGGGLKTTVGAENTLDAHVENAGNFDAYVQVFFEIRDAAGYWVATMVSDTDIFLPAGDSYTFSDTWIAGEPGVYYITAYSFYGELEPTIPSGFSRTLRLKAVQ